MRNMTTAEKRAVTGAVEMAAVEFVQATVDVFGLDNPDRIVALGSKTADPVTRLVANTLRAVGVEPGAFAGGQ